MKEIILSVGIDIGTSTTQLIFCKLTLENLSSSYTVPRISIVDKEVVYRSKIYFTPLKSQTEIDAVEVKKIIQREYEEAKMKPDMLKTGAVIITGETARKKNANLVLRTLSDLAGEFVVATAGPDLESVLSAKGAGIDKLSENENITVANLDIGGGTSNIAVFQKGKLLGVCCLDIGGRLIKIQNNNIIYIYEKIQKLAENNGISIKVGERADVTKLMKVCNLMVEQLAKAIGIVPKDPSHRYMYTNEGRELSKDIDIQAITYSGGVADCIYNISDEDIFISEEDLFRYGDIGILLGKAIQENEAFKKIKAFKPLETIGATVVGAGIHTTNVSGSTIAYSKDKLPIKNIPVIKIANDYELNLEEISKYIANNIPLYYSEGKLEQVAISITGNYHTSFLEVQRLAEAIIKGAAEIIKSENSLVVVVENDIGKVLGNAMNVLLERRKDVICIDGIYAQTGDYIDIGEPIANGRVVPVITKTLIFNS
jgi:ethanolamine utilization protein EutA